LRGERGLSLDALAERAGVSRGMLLQIEQRRVNPSLATLVRVADALDASVNELVDLGATDPVRIVHADEAVDLWRGERGGVGRLLVGSDRLDHLETWIWTIEPGESHAAEAHPRGTREMLYVVDGTLTLDIGGDRFEVAAGDAAVYAADRDHGYANHDPERTLRLLMVVATPPLGRRAGGSVSG
jgi:transcriptional regulator with XRE-family HTH domain